MSESLVFMMGEFEATFPTDRQYARNHMWAQPLVQPQGEQWRFGFTAYAVRLLQDVYFLDWAIDAPASLKERQEIGAIESKKAESDLFAPMAGELSQFNEVLMRDPSMINVDNYGEGWLLEMVGTGSTLLSPEAYLVHLAEVWEVTQRTIKGQLN
jgi:glycine cleavage system H protein